MKTCYILSSSVLFFLATSVGISQNSDESLNKDFTAKNVIWPTKTCNFQEDCHTRNY